MKRISLSTSTLLRSEHALASAPRTVDIQDDAIGQGGFGSVHRVLAMDGRPCPNQYVAKLLSNHVAGLATSGLRTIRELQRRLSARHDDLVRKGSGLLAAHPALLGVPALSFEGQMNGAAVLGHLAVDLGARGYREFGDILEDSAQTDQFRALPLSRRMSLAQQLVDAFDCLGSQAGFVHADVKAEAIFVDTNAGKLAIIDFDSGAVYQNANDRPTTVGTFQDWLAPEIQEQLAAAMPGARVRVDLLSDVWSVNVAICYLMFGFGPLYFLSEMTRRSMDAYLRRYSWPDVDRSFAYFNPSLGPVQPSIARHLRRPQHRRIVEALAQTVNKGYTRPDLRTNYSQWRAILGASLRPSIAAFHADRTVVRDRRPVVLSWVSTGDGQLHLSGVGDVTGRTNASVVLTSDTVFTLTLTPPLPAAPISRSLQLGISLDPARIRHFTSDRALLSGTPEVTLSWDVEAEAEHIEISGIGVVPRSGRRTLTQHADTEYVLRARTCFGVLSEARVMVRVSSDAPTLVVRDVRPRVAQEGQPIRITVDVIGATDVRLMPTGAPLKANGVTHVDALATPMAVRATSPFGVVAEVALGVRVIRRTSIPQSTTPLRTSSTPLRKASASFARP